MTGVTIALFCLTGRDYNSTVKRRPFKTLQANQPDGASGAARGSRPTNGRRHNSPFLRDEEKAWKGSAIIVDTVRRSANQHSPIVTTILPANRLNPMLPASQAER